MHTQTPHHRTEPPARGRPTRTARRRTTGAIKRGMTLVELLLSIAVAAGVLGGLTLISESLRADTSDQQTRRTLRLLRTALTHYYDRHAAWPPGPTAAHAIEALLADPETAVMIRPLQPQQETVIRDGYDRPIRYVVQTDGNMVVADFVSTGPDGRLGDLTSDHPEQRLDAMDNLYGSDLEAPTP